MGDALLIDSPESPARFFRDHLREVHSFISRTTGADSSDVEDIVQETFLHAWKSRENFRGNCSPATWLIGIAKNKIRDRWRRRKARVEPSVFAEIDRAPLPEEVVRSAETGALVRRALAEIGDEYARLLIRRHFEGESVRKIAEDLDESEDAVESRLRRARQALRDRLMEKNEDD